MRRPAIYTLIVLIVALLLLISLAWSPRDFLTRRLAAAMIAGSSTFKTPQPFLLHTGVVSNRDYLSPEILVLLQRGWLSATSASCPRDLAPPPCWDIALTPSGVDTFRPLMSPNDAGKQDFSIPAARRELVAIAGISKQGGAADVDFIWRWSPVNEVGAAIYSGDVRYRSTVAFRSYDDGWRLVQRTFRPGQSLDDALKNAEPAH
ncbi:MAG: hypothetical protein WCA16_06845 [Candidatus Sulfotelmatobacter sp.]